MSEENKEVKKFIIIFIIVIIVVVGIYFFTKNVVKKDENIQSDTNTDQTQEVNIDYNSVIVGNMLNKNESNYYVILYRSKDDNVGEYMTLISNYQGTSSKMPLYKVDLSSGLNSKFYDPEHINLNPNDINDYRFGNITLLEVKEGKVIKTYTELEDIKKLWKLS